MPVAMPIQTDWVQERPLRPRLPGPDQGRGDQGLSGHARGMRRRARPERDDEPEPVDGADAALVPDGDREPRRGWRGSGLVVSTTHERGKVKTYYVPDPPERDSTDLAVIGADRDQDGDELRPIRPSQGR